MERETKKRPPLCYDQCAHSKETGHWKNECPHRRGTSKGWKKFTQSNKERYQNLTGLARAESDYGRLGSLILGPWEPTVMIKVGGQSMTFMVDTEAEHSINHICGCLHRPNSNCCWGHRGHGSPLILQGPFIQVGGHLVTHEFLYLPECPIPLLGRDLLTKLGAQITFTPQKACEPHLGEPIGSDDGRDHAQGR